MVLAVGTSWRISAIVAAAFVLLAPAVLAPGPADGSTTSISRPGRGQLRHFSVLRTRPEGLPPPLPDIVALPVPPRWPQPACPGANAALAQRLTGGSRSVWIVPGRGCLEAIQAFGEVGRGPVVIGFGTTARAVRFGISASTAGVVPDGVIAARLSPTITVPVSHNVYRLPARPERRALWREPRLIRGAFASGG